MLIVCCDGLTGFPEAIEATWTAGDRADLRGAPDPGRDAVRELQGPQGRRRRAQADLHRPPTPTPPGPSSTRSPPPSSGQKYPNTVATFETAWERFTPFLAFPPELRRVIYTTNSIESLNYQLRKIIKNRGHFPNDAAVVKLLWLAICNIEDKRARDRAKERGTPAEPNAKPPADSSKARSPPTGNKPSPNSPSPTPTASTPTSNQ